VATARAGLDCRSRAELRCSCPDSVCQAKRQRTYFRGIQKRGIQVHEVPLADLALAREIVSGFEFEVGPVQRG